MQKLIDTHHHLWQLSGGITYPWLQDNIVADFFLGDYTAIRHDFQPDDLLALIPDGYELLASVHCEAECDRGHHYEEANWIDGLSCGNSGIAARQMVWVDLLADDVNAQLGEMAMMPSVRGVRCKPRTVANPNDIATLGIEGSLQDPRWQRGLSALQRHNLVWDLRVPAWHLAEAASLLANFPELRIVVNHCGLPWDRSKTGLQTWRAGMAALAALPDCWLKLSELGCPGQSYDQPLNQQLLNEALAIFGGDKAMFASNAPVSGLQIHYADWLVMVETAIAEQCPAEKQGVLWRNAAKCYQMNIYRIGEKMTQSLEGVSLIGYDRKRGNGQAINAVNPATDEQLEPAYGAVSEGDIDQAVDLAWSAFLQYRELDDATRANFLDAIAEEIEAIGSPLIERAMAETGLPQARLEGERGRTCGQLRLFAEVLRDGKYQDIRHDEALPDRKPMPRPDLCYRRIALGPVAVFGASNFPLAFSVAGGDTASALAAGCPVVVKAHNAHPGTSELVGNAVVAAAKRCDMPEGVFSLLYGSGNELGQKLAAHPHIKAVGFTGSRRAGTALMNTAANREEPIPVYAEMSSINPVYLMPAALKVNGADIGQSLVQSMMMGAGQFCTSPGLIFAIDGEGFNDFVDSAKNTLAEQGTQTMLTPGIAKAYAEGVSKLKSAGQVENLSSGQSSDQPNQCQAQLFITDGAALESSNVINEEVFGSAAVIVRCKDFAEMQRLTEKLEGQLTASVHSTDQDSVDDLKALISQLERKVGRILFNGFGTGVEVASAMVHGGPFPATSDGRSTSVGTAAIERFLRAVCYQNVPQAVLPDVLKDC